MSIEEKAKAYDKALDNAKVVYKTIRKDLKPVIEQIFPELKESDDDRIRKELIKLLRNLFNNYSYFIKDPFYTECIAWLEKQSEMNIQNNNPLKIEPDKFYFCIKDYFAGGCYRSKKGDIVLAKNGMNMMGLSPKEASEYFMPINPFNEDAIAWLEKQGKTFTKKDVDNANKVKPKLKIEKDNWYVCIRNLDDDYGTRAFYKDNIYHSTKDETLIPDNSNVPYEIKYCAEDYFRLWNIQDAKDGDILITENNEKPFIFKGLDIRHSNKPIAYGGVVDSGYFMPSNKCTNRWTDGNVCPANKEQRELLFKEIKKAGYKWNKNKKELKRI